MIQHHPYGIDDPYKHLPTERSPRDPEPLEAIQVGFTCPTATSAWLTLHSATGDERFEASTLGNEQWVAQIPPLPSGSYRYRLQAQTANGEVASAEFPLEIGIWRAATRAFEVTVDPCGLRLRLESDDGSAQIAASLSVPTAGVCRIEFSVGGEVMPNGLACVVRRHTSELLLDADGLALKLDLDTLSLHAWHPEGQRPQFTGSLRVRWLETPGGLVTRFEASWTPDTSEGLYGLGERFDAPDKRGRALDVRVYEEYKEQGARTYLPVPLVVSSRAYGLWLEALEPSVFDLRGPECRIRLEKRPSRPSTLCLHVIVATEPYGVTAAFTRLTGQIAVPPQWAFGPWMSSNDWNTQHKAQAVIRRTLQEDVPSTALVLEAWSDESTFYIFNDAEYSPKPGAEAFKLEDFSFKGRWPDPKALVDECHTNGIRVLLWQIPVQKHVSEWHPQHHADEAFMLEHQFGILKDDGSAYRCRGWWFTDGLVMDFSNPAAARWWFEKRRYLFDELGIDGMKTDGGEHLWGRELRAFDGKRGLELYNGYPNQYVGAYHQFVQERTNGNGLTFSRAGYSGAQRFPGHWAGDENSTWSAFKSSIQAGLSAGLSGISIWGWDIGGFSGDIPSVELYLRSTAFACFCPIMQYHSELNPASENRDRSPWNIAERHNDPRALEVYRRYAKLRMRLLEYLHTEAEALSASGLPLLRYPALEFPGQREFLAADPHAALFTRDLLVCPVVEKGALAREVRLPPGEWLDAWSGTRFSGNQHLIVPAPLERIPIFIRADSPRAAFLLEQFKGF